MRALPIWRTSDRMYGLHKVGRSGPILRLQKLEDRADPPYPSNDLQPAPKNIIATSIIVSLS